MAVPLSSEYALLVVPKIESPALRKINLTSPFLPLLSLLEMECSMSKQSFVGVNPCGYCAKTVSEGKKRLYPFNVCTCRKAHTIFPFFVNLINPLLILIVLVSVLNIFSTLSEIGLLLIALNFVTSF